MLGLLLLGAATVASVSCSDDGGPLLVDGTILVGARTTGSDLDADGYLVSVNSGQGQRIGFLDTIFVTALEPGDYVVSLGGMATNCTLPLGANPQDAVVEAGDTVEVLFNVTCVVPGGGGGGGGGNILGTGR